MPHIKKVERRGTGRTGSINSSDVNGRRTRLCPSYDDVRKNIRNSNNANASIMLAWYSQNRYIRRHETAIQHMQRLANGAGWDL
jgi:hypothetical protein